MGRHNKARFDHVQLSYCCSHVPRERDTRTAPSGLSRCGKVQIVGSTLSMVDRSLQRYPGDSEELFCFVYTSQRAYDLISST